MKTIWETLELDVFNITTLVQRWHSHSRFGDTKFQDEEFFWGHGTPLPWVGCENNLETLELDVFNAAV